MRGPNLAGREWHLVNTGQPGGVAGIDLNVAPLGGRFTGQGVTVGIWDDGIEYDHPDLRGAYDPALHIRVGGAVHDPRPALGSAAHGTAVAGIIAAADDGSGVVGVAPGVRIAGVDILSPRATRADTFGALAGFDVTNHSWGPDFAYEIRVLNRDWVADYTGGLYASSVTGRDGLGTINVFSAGNGRIEGRHTNDSVLTSVAHAIAVGAVTQSGEVSWYSTPGATLLVAAPSNGGVAGIWTTDRRGAAGYSDGRNETANDEADYTSEFGGTSASAPMVSGVVALMLEANPGLGWRDVQEILALTARHVGSAVGESPRGDELYGWGFNAATTWNGGGLHHSNDYGFGLVDAHAAVRLAESWTKVQAEATRSDAVAAGWTGLARVRDGDPKGIALALEVTGRHDLETVSVDLGFAGGLMSEYRIELVSPAGTTSVLSLPTHDAAGRSDWVFASKAFWGEAAEGTWTLRIADGVKNFTTGFLASADLRLEGGIYDRDDIHVFTEAFSDYAGAGFGHSGAISDRNGGHDTLNAAALRSDVRFDLAAGIGLVDGVAVTLSGRFEAVTGGDGDDRIIGTTGNETLAGMRGADVIAGRPGADRISGGAGGDRLSGGSGRDRIDGGAGNDALYGGKGRDVLRDGPGRDLLSGGGGADMFRLSRDGLTDAIADFEPGFDTIRLVAEDFGALVIADRGPDEVLVRAGDERLLVAGDGVSAATLDAGDFLFA